MSQARSLRAWLVAALMCCVIAGVGFVSAQADQPDRSLAAEPLPTIPGRRISVTSAQVEVGEIFEVAIKDTHPGGASVQLEYDPTMLQVVDAQGNPGDYVDVPYCSHAQTTFCYHHAYVYHSRGFVNVNVRRDVAFDVRTIGTFYVRALQEGEARIWFRSGTWAYYGNVIQVPPWVTLVDGVITIGQAPGPTPTDTPPQRLLYGTVLDTSGQPVVGAKVGLARWADAWYPRNHAYTNATGAFQMWMRQLSGDYRLTLETPPGYTVVESSAPPGLASHPAEIHFTLDDSADDVGPFTYVLSQEPTPIPTLPAAPLDGYVWLDGAEGNPLDGQRQPGEGLEGVVVTLDAVADATGLRILQQTTTDEEGYYTFTVGAGEYVISVHDPLERVQDQSRAVVANETPEPPMAWTIHFLRLPLLLRTKQ